MVGSETVGISLAEKLVEVCAHMGELLVIGVEQREVACAQRTGYARHAIGIESLPDVFVNDSEASVGVIDEVLDIVGLEVGEDRHDDSSIGEGCYEGHTPL